MTEEKITVKTMEQMKYLAAKGVIKPAPWEWLAMSLIEQNREMDRRDNAVTRIMGAEVRGKAGGYNEPEQKRPFWRGWWWGVAIGLVLIFAAYQARADMILELHGDAGTEFMLQGTLTNTGDTVLDYRIGAQAFVASGYAFTWAEGFADQFGPLAPGESLVFDWAWCWWIEEQPIYSAWLELQAYDGTTMVMSQRASIDWTEAMGVSQMTAPMPDIQGAMIRAETVPEPATIWLLAIGLGSLYLAKKKAPVPVAGN